MSRKSLGPVMEIITDADKARFDNLAAAVLRRSGPAYFADEMGQAFSFFLVGGIPIVGLLYWNWSASAWLLFLLFSAWLGIFIDAAKFIFLRARVMATADIALEDNFVWTMVDALRDGKDVAQSQHLRAKYQPRMGIFVDFLFGGVGTLMVVGMFPGSLTAGLAEGRSLQACIGLVAAYRLAHASWQIIEQRSENAEGRRVRLAVGLRGAGLFLLGFLTAVIGDATGAERADGMRSAWWIAIIVNGLALFVAVLNVWGLTMLQGNARWLRKHLDRENIANGTDHGLFDHLRGARRRA